MKNRKRILAGLLTAIMTISMLPSAAFASESVEDEPAAETAVVSSEEYEVEPTVEEVPEAVTEEAVSEEVVSEEAVTEETTAEEAAEPSEETAAAEEAEEPVSEEAVTEAPAEETAETAVQTKTLEAEGKDYVVTITYNAKAEIPDDARIKVEEVFENSKKYDYADYVEQAAEAIESEVDELNYVRLFDISIVDADGKKIEPESTVDVQIRLKDVKKVEETTQVVHFAGEDETPELIDAEIKGKNVSFETDGFSIYAVIGTGDYETITVNFYGADYDPEAEENTPLETVYVKELDKNEINGQAPQLDTIIYDPGAGEMPDEYTFYGWSIGVADYPVDVRGKNIDQVKDYIRGLDFSTVEDHTLNIYAMVVTYYKVDYVDGDGYSLGSGRALTKKAGEPAEYTVNMGYSTDDEHNFEGWHVKEGLNNIIEPADTTAETLFPNETEIKIKGDVTFSVVAPEGHWLVFNENGKHASYNAPRFVKSDDNTNGEGLETVRNGYTFGGWYTGAPSEEGGEPTGEEFEFGHKLEDTITLYAKWNPISNADYTIIVWKESLAGGWDFADSKVLNGRVGAVTDKVVRQGSGKEVYALIDGTEYKYPGFNFSEYDSSKTIAPEGNTVINVRFTRNEYTLTFWTTSYLLEIPVRVVATFTEKFGTDISSHFPMRGTILNWPVDVLGLNSLARWDAQPPATTYDKPVVYIDTMPAEDIVFYANRSVVDQRTMYYYVEALPDQTPVKTFNGKDFVLYKGPLYARYNYFTETEDYMDILGCEKYGTNVTFDSQGRSTANTLECYYTRVSKRINYMDGAYFDGDDYRMYLGSGQRLPNSDIDPVLYGSDISSYNKGGDNYFETESPDEGFVLEGWFVDQACTQPYTFDRMSSSDITVYAKWRQIQYRVFLRTNVPEDDTSLTWGSEGQQTNFRVSYGSKVSAPYGIRTGYKFYGWHKDPEMTIPVYSQGIVLNKDTVPVDNAQYNYDKTKTENYTDPSNKYGNASATSNADVERFWITQRYELFARWGKEIPGAKGIGIHYDAGDDGTNPPADDPVLYQDNTEVVAGAAPKAKAGKVFKGWVVQKWNGSYYDDTEVVRLPGETFFAYVDDAKIVDAETGDIVEEAVEEGNYIYTIQLKATYEDKEETVPTHITWYKNDGTGETYRSDVNIKINQAVSVYGLGSGETAPARNAYTFLGWAKGIERATATDPANTSTNETTANFLEYKDGKYYLPGTTTEITEVAADEVTPYEALYAIWKRKPQIHIYHSATGEIEDVEIPADGTPIDLTAKVTEDYLYGGYYSYVNGGKGTAQTSSGKSLAVTLADDDKTFYLKEVNKSYLKPAGYIVYNKTHNGLIQDFYAIVNVDAETNGSTDYVSCGVIVTSGSKSEDKNSTTPALEYVVEKPTDKEGEKITVETINGSSLGTAGAAIAAFQITDYVVGGATVQIRGYWVTKDGIKVTGYSDRMVQFDAVNQDYAQYTPNVCFTGWKNSNPVIEGKTSNTKTGFKKVGTTITETVVNSETGNAMVPRRLAMIIAPSEKLEFKVTKFSGSTSTVQTVEEGDQTGKITYKNKSGYIFAGWYQDEKLTIPADFSDIREDVTVYAKYVSKKDVTLTFIRKKNKTGTVTFDATVAVNNTKKFAEIGIVCDNDGKQTSTVLGKVSTTKSGTKKNPKYTYKFTGSVKVKGLAKKDSFTAEVYWVTPDGTKVKMDTSKCKYSNGVVKVQ